LRQQEPTRADSEHLSRGPNNANILGNIAAGGLSNVYYPPSDRGVSLTFQRALTVTAEATAGAIFVEFWPDIERKLFHKKQKSKP
jgi:hypothetical protein